MYNKTQVVSSLYGLVGFENPANPIYQRVSTENQASRSGRFYTDSPYCKIEWFVDNMDYEAADTTQINAELKALSDNAVMRICDKVFDKSDYIDRQLLYQNANNKIHTDNLPAGNFVGYRIQTSLEKNVAFKITRTILEFEGTGDLTLYLFNSAEKEPIQNETVSITSANQSLTLDWVIDYNASYYKGDFYFGYLADEAITAGLTPIKRDYNAASIKSIITYQCWENIQVPGVTTAELWDLDNIEGTDECWGLNPDITVYEDFTDLVIQNQHLFAKAIEMQGQINFLQKIISSRRSNFNERLSKEVANKLLVEIEGIADTNKIGLKRELRAELGTLRKEIERLQLGYYPGDFILNTLS